MLQQIPVVVSSFMEVYIAPGFPTHALLRCSLQVKQIAYQGLLQFHTETFTFPFQRLLETLFVLDVEFLLEIKWYWEQGTKAEYVAKSYLCAIEKQKKLCKCICITLHEFIKASVLYVVIH